MALRLLRAIHMMNLLRRTMNFKTNSACIAVVDLNGMVAKGRSFNRINLERFKPALKRAFNRADICTVALCINSPGGSPVQSALLYDYIKSLREKNDKVKVVAFVEDVCASGGYYIACAADKIIADRSSIVGSIGVVRPGVGLVDLIKKIGVERRVYAAGRSKVVLDPLLPEKESDIRKVKDILKNLHTSFIDVVKASRGEKLRYDAAYSKALEHDPSIPEIAGKENLVEEGYGLFDGSYYDGTTALDLGLIDSIGNLESYIRHNYKEGEYYIYQCRPRPVGFDGLFTGSIGTRFISEIRNSMEAEELWSKYKYL